MTVLYFLLERWRLGLWLPSLTVTRTFQSSQQNWASSEQIPGYCCFSEPDWRWYFSEHEWFLHRNSGDLSPPVCSCIWPRCQRGENWSVASFQQILITLHWSITEPEECDRDNSWLKWSHQRNHQAEKWGKKVLYKSFRYKKKCMSQRNHDQIQIESVSCDVSSFLLTIFLTINERSDFS